MEFSAVQREIDAHVHSINGVYHTLDVGDFVVGVPADRNTRYIADALSLPNIFEVAVKKFLSGAKFDNSTVRCTFGLSHGEAFFTAGTPRISVGGRAVNEAIYALAAAESLHIRMAFDSELSKLVSDKYELRPYTIFLQTINEEREVFAPT